MFVRGDIIKVDFNPVRGHEQGNYRPAMVINSVPLPGGISIVLPITTKVKTFPLEVELDNRTMTQGVVLCFQVRTIDLQARNASFIEKAPDDIICLCCDYVKRVVDDID